LARADRHMLLNAGNDVQRWWRLVYTVLTGMVELLRVGICERVGRVQLLQYLQQSFAACVDGMIGLHSSENRAGIKVTNVSF